MALFCFMSHEETEGIVVLEALACCIPVLVRDIPVYEDWLADGKNVLRWNVQRGVVVIPKSTHKERIEENFSIWDFTLTEDEMQRISSIDQGYVGTAVKHFDPEFVRGCTSRKIHD